MVGLGEAWCTLAAVLLVNTLLWLLARTGAAGTGTGTAAEPRAPRERRRPGDSTRCALGTPPGARATVAIVVPAAGHVDALAHVGDDVLGAIFAHVDSCTLVRAVPLVCRRWQLVCQGQGLIVGHVSLHAPRLGKPHPHPGPSIDALLSAVLERFRGVRSLTLADTHGRSISAGSLAAAAGSRSCIGHLASLDLSTCAAMHGGALGHLSGLVRLASLRLAACTGAFSLEPLAALPLLATLDLSGCSGITDQSLADLARAAPRLRTLVLRACGQLTDAGVAHLGTLERLEALDLCWVQGVTRVGLVSVSHLQHLTTLDLHSCVSVADGGLRAVSRLRALTSLDLSWCTVSDAGMPHLASLGSLVALVLTDATITDAGLDVLPCLTRLASLDLCSCRYITDAGLSRIGRLPRLTFLGLCNCGGVTGAGLVHLAPLSALARLNLRNTGVAAQAGALAAVAHVPVVELQTGRRRRILNPATGLH